ncbi:rhomboid family intramembrane serine protease [Pseudaestuariivita sp.]|uniref:rhomboid family intramembrane serine protease n=1 Tax=Pseudaestuariivita sp. TaxID=2211669 RepID=UPI004059AC45
MALKRFGWVIALVAVIWLVQGVNLVTGYALNPRFGLIPRFAAGLDGVLFMPVLHGSVAHAASNTVPLLILGGLTAATAGKVKAAATAIIVVLGGLGVWLFGASAIHVGASGLVFGWLGFLIARGFVERKPIPLIVSLAVGLVYGTMLWGVLPGQPGISWEAHLFGALAGLVAALFLRSD